MNSQKDILFFSNFCKFSKDVINTITKHNLRDSFMFVCVDNKKYNIPEFIDRVPSILKKNGEVYTDEQLQGYLEMKYKMSNTIEEINPMFSMYGSSMYSANFSTIDGNDNSSIMDNPNFVSLGHEQHMIHVSQDTNEVSKKSSFDSSKAYERLMESRNLDDKSIKQVFDVNTNGGTLKPI